MNDEKHADAFWRMVCDGWRQMETIIVQQAIAEARVREMDWNPEGEA